MRYASRHRLDLDFPSETQDYNSGMGMTIGQHREFVDAEFTPLEPVVVVRQNPENHVSR